MSDKLEKYFVEEISLHNMKDPLEILNWYRNLYYKEASNTERGIVANAINDLIVKYKPEVSPCDKCANNPKNGGNGICNCILGTPIIS